MSKTSRKMEMVAMTNMGAMYLKGGEQTVVG